jgi:UPF0716 family protein affecting phage T7 exclusion
MLIRRLLIFGYPLVEILLLWWVASIIGWGFALLLVLAGFPAGAALMRNAAAKSVTLSTAPDSDRPKILRGATGMFASGLLIMIPGFLTDLLGLILLFPPVQSLLFRRAGNWIQMRMMSVPGFNGPANGQVIKGVVIIETDKNETGEEPRGSSPQINP